MDTDSIYVRKSALKRLEGAEAFIPMKKNATAFPVCSGGVPSAVAPAQWRDQDEELHMPVEHAAYLAKPDYIANTKKDPSPSTAPPRRPAVEAPLELPKRWWGQRQNHDSDRALLPERSPRLHPTHRLAKQMRIRGFQAQTYHSFYRWSGKTEWTSERMRQEFMPRVIIWDEVCTTPRPTLETFPDWLEGRDVQVICCGRPETAATIAGEMSHVWLRAIAQQSANYYEEVEVDHRAKDPLLKALKKRIRLQPDKVQCQEMRKVLPCCVGWGTLRGGLEAL